VLKKLKVLCVLSCFVLLTTCFAQNSYAFHTGDNPKWSTPNMTWSYRYLSYDYRGSAALAIANWNNTPTPLTFSMVSDANYNNARVHINGDNFGNTDYNAITYHYHAFYNDDIVSANFYFMDHMDMDHKGAVFAHELGHVFGLDHVKDTKQIMCTALDGRTALKPNTDDIAGVNYLY
jgi:hypothetical protein